MTDSDPWGNSNSVIKQKAILPGENQKLAEAALIDMTDKNLKIIEKKYDVNGVKTNYFSQLFLQCHGSLSPKSKLAIVAKAVDDVQKKFYHESEQFEVQMETKSIINQALEEDGGFAVPVLIDKIFKEQEEMKEQVIEKLDKAVNALNKFMKSQGLECKPEEVSNLKGDTARAEFIDKFKEVQRLKTQLDQYTDIKEDQAAVIAELLPEDTLRAFRGAYLETAGRLKEQQGKDIENKAPEVEQLDFEFVLFSSAIIDYDYIMALIAKYTQTEPKKQKMSKEQLTGMLSATSNLLDEREDIIEYIDSLQVGVALDEKEIKAGYQKFREQKNNQEINIIAKKHGIEIQSLQAFIQEIIDRMIFDGEKLGDLLTPLDLSWRERTQKELDLVADLIPLLKRMADGREIVGLNAYE